MYVETVCGVLRNDCVLKPLVQLHGEISVIDTSVR